MGQESTRSPRRRRLRRRVLAAVLGLGVAVAGLIAAGPGPAAAQEPAAGGSARSGGPEGGGLGGDHGSGGRGRPADDVPVPTVTGPVAGDPWTASPPVDWEEAGYTQEEFFLAGTARAYLNDGEWGDDGRWNARLNPDATAPYVTRALVRRPTDPTDFNGTVVVEWVNVSAGLDVEVDWVFTRDELLRRGYAWVGVSAQAVGVDFLRGQPRYAQLAHPGDAFSYDIYSQAARALTDPPDSGPRPLGDLTDDVERLLADGESQSAGRLVTYVNAVHPQVRVFDGFLVHSASRAAPLSQPGPPGSPPTPSIPGGDVPTPVARFRTDRREPVLLFNTETDVVPRADGAPSGLHEQPDGRNLRIWR